MPNVFTRNRTLIRQALPVLAVLGLGLVILAMDLGGTADPNLAEPNGKEPEKGSAPLRVHKPVAVAVNPSVDAHTGFRGDIHPLLHGRTELEVTADWRALEKSRLKLEAPDEVLAWYTGLQPAERHRMYSARDFSAFLPESLTEIGQIWSLDSEKIKTLLKQFHPNASMHLVASGRRAGPDGSFAILRAISPSHADIEFRIHSEFLVSPNDAGPYQAVFAWYTPAYFSGNVLINKTTGTVERFRLALPTEKAINVFLTVNPSLLGIPKLGHDIVRVERMELSGGDSRVGEAIAWTKSISATEAGRRLARTFYKFEEIDWLPFDQVAAQAKSKNRPIFAIVSWGATDDQSC